MMSDVRSVAASLVMIIAVGIAPVAADSCASACEAMHEAMASRAGAAAAPPCHHSTSILARVDHPSMRCGHDHHPVPFLTSSDARSAGSTPGLVGAVLPVTAAAAIGVADAAATAPGSGPPLDSVPLALSSSLRI